MTETTRFSGLQIGEDIPSLSRGPLLPPHLMRWSAAIENWHRVHYDQEFTVEHDKLPALLINGSWKQHFLVQAVRSWAEPEGWLQHIGFQFRAMDVVGAELTAWGRIADLREQDGFGLVDLEIGITNRTAGHESTPGTATVVMPLTADQQVPYPFPVVAR